MQQLQTQPSGLQTQASASPSQEPLIIAVASDKGGSNKTTASTNIASVLANRGFNVVVVDLDQQGDATKSLANPDHIWEGSTGEVLLGDRQFIESLVPTAIPTLWVLPADKELRGVDGRLMRARPYDFINVLKVILKEQAGGFDFVFLDCPGNAGTFTALALVAADAYLVPCQPKFLSLDGAKSIVEVAENLTKQNLAPKLKFAGVFFSPFNPDKRNSKIMNKVMAAAEKRFPGEIFTYVREDKGIDQSQVDRVPLVVSEPNSPAVQDYQLLADQLVTTVRDLIATSATEQQHTPRSIAAGPTKQRQLSN